MNPAVARLLAQVSRAPFVVNGPAGRRSVADQETSEANASGRP